MRYLAITVIPLTALLCSTPAAAEITVTRAEYKAGVLVVRGETSRSNQRVTLDRRYSTRTDRNNVFRFRIRYLPGDCTLSIRAGQQVRPAYVANCRSRGVRPAAPRPGRKS